MSIQDLKKFRQQGSSATQKVQQSSSKLKSFKSSLPANRPVKQPEKQTKGGGFWNGTMRALGTLVSSASNALEDTGKTIGYGIGRVLGSKKTKQDLGIDFWGHQKDVFTGKNTRTYSDITRDISKDMPKAQGRLLNTVGYGGDFILDPLNKVKIAALTAKGVKASKTGRVALSVADQAKQGQRALLQIGNKSILPGAGNKVLQGSTALNDWLRGTKAGGAGVKALSSISTKVRPLGVARDEFKTFKDAKTSASNLIGYKSDKAMEIATDIFKSLKEKKATQAQISNVLHAIEKGDKRGLPQHLHDIFDKGLDFKKANQADWTKFGGSTIEGHGLSHIATDEVADASRKKALSGGKLFSPKTPQDIHRKWMKVNGEITNLDEAGIKYMPDVIEKGKGGFFDKAGNVVKVEQATAQEINNAVTKQGKNAIFKEDLPVVMAKMGLSTARKAGGQTFLDATKGIKSEAGQKLVNQTHERMSNVEALNKVIGGFDKAQGWWKSQALVAPSYHIRNAVGNVWNNALAGVNPAKYFKQGKVSPELLDEMKRMGVIGEGQYGKDIEKVIEGQIKGGNWNPFSRDFKLFRGNMKIGSAVEDNARKAHYLSKKAEGFTPEEAAKSVQKYLFDYGDLTWGEKNILKRALPFYTWSSKNLPLQLSELVKQPGKFSKIAVAKKDIEAGVDQPNEKYMSDYIKSGAPIRFRKDPKDGTTQYLLLGQWLPAAQAINVISDPVNAIKGMITPAVKTPLETMFNKSGFFTNTLGEASKIENKPGEKKNFLGFDVSPKTKNILSSIRVANELDKLNPGEIFGSQGKASIWKKLGIEKGSAVRGSRYSPDSTQTTRLINFLVGKSTNYDPKQAKFFYDRDTTDRVKQIKDAIKEAQKNKQPELAKKTAQELRDFLKQRNSK